MIRVLPVGRPYPLSRDQVNLELRHKIFSILQKEPTISQRELADRLGISLGKTNYCLNALVEKGWIKARNFKNSKNKRAYSYLLTPRGMEEKARLVVRFLRKKQEEYEQLKKAIEELEAEVSEIKLAEAGTAAPMGKEL